MKEEVIAIVGPTAVGKTRLSLELAQEFEAEIISGDSMQVYRGLDIGTAKVEAKIRDEVPHHLIDIAEPEEEFSVADFQKEADKLIPEIHNRNKIPMIVGGTGLYIKALIEGFIFPETEADWDLRNRLEAEAEAKGTEAVHNKLAEIDPELADKLHPNDLRRVIRGIEVYQQTGNTITHYKKLAKKRPPRYDATIIGLYRDREILYNRINKRVEQMMEEGLLEEVKSLYEQGYDKDTPAMEGLGYKELLSYFAGEYDLEEAVRLIKRNTRHFAKRQLTWFKKNDEIHWFDMERDFVTIENEVKEVIRNAVDNV